MKRTMNPVMYHHFHVTLILYLPYYKMMFLTFILIKRTGYAMRTFWSSEGKAPHTRCSNNFSCGVKSPVSI